MRLDLATLFDRLVESRAPMCVRALCFVTLAIEGDLFAVTAPELLVPDPHWSDFLDDTVDVTAVGTEGTFASCCRKLPHVRCDCQRVKIRASEHG